MIIDFLKESDLMVEKKYFKIRGNMKKSLFHNLKENFLHCQFSQAS